MTIYYDNREFNDIQIFRIYLLQKYFLEFLGKKLTFRIKDEK